MCIRAHPCSHAVGEISPSSRNPPRQRVSKPPSKFVDYVMLASVGEPSCYHEAISVHDHAKWKQAMQNELDSMDIRIELGI